MKREIYLNSLLEGSKLSVPKDPKKQQFLLDVAKTRMAMAKGDQEAAGKFVTSRDPRLGEELRAELGPQLKVICDTISIPTSITIIRSRADSEDELFDQEDEEQLLNRNS